METLDGGYKKLGQYTQPVFGYAVQLEPVNIEGLAEEPFLLVAEPPANMWNVPLFASLLFHAKTTPYVSSGTFSVGYEGEPTLLKSSVASTILTETVDSVQVINLTEDIAVKPAVDLKGRGIILSMTVAPSGGDGELYVATYFVDPYCSW